MHFAGKFNGVHGDTADAQRGEDRPRLRAASPPPQLPPALASPKVSPWPERRRVFARWVAAGAGWVSAALSRPRVRLCVIGLFLLLLGGLVVTSSVWTLPLVIAGAAMVLIAWVGSRLDGRLAVQWGENGTQLEFRAEIKAPNPAHRPQASIAAPSAQAEPEDADVVEGEAHTVEIDVAELKALIAAADAAEAQLGHPQRPAA